MSEIEPLRGELFHPAGVGARLDRRTYGELRRLGNQTVVRMARVQAEANVAVEKDYELTRVATAAMGNHVFLERQRAAMVGGDQLLFDALGAYVEMTMFGQLETLRALKHKYGR